MREKVRDLIYLDTKRYTSLENLRVFYWAIAIIPFFMMVISIVSINKAGINWKSLFPIVSFSVWSLFYWMFVLAIQSKHTKKSFELRFLVNGISGLFLSSLFWIFSASFSITADTPFLEFDLFLWMLVFYLLFSAIYIFAIILCVHKGVFASMREQLKTKTALMVSAFFGALIPSSGAVGMHTSRLIRTHTNINTQLLIMTILTIVLIFLPALAHINFVQFYYCKKYGIDCDEHGNNTSPKLERKPKKSKPIKDKPKKSNKNGKKKMPLILKILISIACVPIAAFILLLLIGFLINL